MRKIKIIGAGSIANHLAHACRHKNWQVDPYDLDDNALERTKNLFFYSRVKKHIKITRAFSEPLNKYANIKIS